MARYLDLFPKTRYSLTDSQYPDYQTITNILFRISIIRDILNNTASYFQYTVRDGDTPEILAEKVYKNPEAHWIILYANNIIDPQYDWPLNSKAFYNYIVNKYKEQAGNPANDYEVISWAQGTVHHYEKVIKRHNTSDDVTYEKAFEINFNRKTINQPNSVYEYYDALPEESFATYNINGKTVNETITKRSVSIYDYEDNLNEEKRNIKIIKDVYYPQIMQEFNSITNNRNIPFLRKLV